MGLIGTKEEPYVHPLHRNMWSLAVPDLDMSGFCQIVDVGHP